ncbi:MAG: helix-turn-helix transcriptional regulator [Clostridiales bacterium]
MSFGEKLRSLRQEAGMSQAELARRLGVTERSIHNYEANARYPKGQGVLRGIAATFGVTADYLVDDTIPLPADKQQKKDKPSRREEASDFLSAAGEAYGSKGRKEAARLLEEAGMMFAGGELSEEDKDAFFQSITQAYFAAKNKAREKFGQKEKKSF